MYALYYLKRNIYVKFYTKEITRREFAKEIFSLSLCVSFSRPIRVSEILIFYIDIDSTARFI